MGLRRQLHAAVLGGVATLAGMAGLSRQAEAAFIVTLEEVGSDVVLMGSGTLNTTALTADGTSTQAPGLTPPIGFLGIGAPTFQQVDSYSDISGPAGFGSGGGSGASSGSGDIVALSGFFSVIAVPHGYVSGAALSDTSTFTGKTLANLGVTPGTYVWTWGSGDNADSFTLHIISPDVAVPEPASALLLGLPITGMMVARRWGKQSDAA